MANDNEFPPGLDSKERKLRAGHEEVLGETVAKFALFERGWNPYSHFLDHEKIDIVARKQTRTEILYADVQVKKGTLFEVGQKAQRELFDVTWWRPFNPKAFDKCNPNLVVAIVLIAKGTGEGMSEYKGDIFLFKAADFADLLRNAVPSGDRVKVLLARSQADPRRWYWCTSWKKGMTLEDSTIEVTSHRQNFGVLEAVALRHKLGQRSCG